MPLDLIRDVFNPVAEPVISRADSLIGLERRSPTLGVEGWLKVEAARALGNLVSQIRNKGPDLELRNSDTTITIELKGANDLNCTSCGLPQGVNKYRDIENFGGCIFLGDGTSKEKIANLNSKSVYLISSILFQAGEKMWVIGLLIPIKASDNPRQPLSTDLSRHIGKLDWPVDGLDYQHEVRSEFD